MNYKRLSLFAVTRSRTTATTRHSGIEIIARKVLRTLCWRQSGGNLLTLATMVESRGETQNGIRWALDVAARARVCACDAFSLATRNISAIANCALYKLVNNLEK